MYAKKCEEKGIFCLETHQWYGPKDQSSVEPGLQLLEGFKDIPYKRWQVATSGELRYFLRQFFATGYRNYPILYLAFHGFEANSASDAGIVLGDGTEVELERLESWLGNRFDAKGRLIYFGSCEVLNTHGRSLNPPPY